MRRSLVLPIGLLLIKHGLRPSEALCLPLDPDGLDLGAGVAHVLTARLADPDEGPEELALTTDESRRTVPLDPEVVDALRTHVARTGVGVGELVFRLPNDRPVSLAVLRNDVAKAATLAGLEGPTPVPYDLRRTYVSYAFAAGVAEAPLARLLGHRHGISLARQRYAQALQRDVAAVAGLIDAFLRTRRPAG